MLRLDEATWYEEKDFKSRQRVRDRLCSHCFEPHKKTRLYNCNAYSEGLRPVPCRLPGFGLLSVGPYEPR